MGRIGDIADLVTGLALLGGGYLIYRAVKEGGALIPEIPGIPEIPELLPPPAEGGEVTGYDALTAWLAANAGPIGAGFGGGGGGVRNGTTSTGKKKASSRHVYPTTPLPAGPGGVRVGGGYELR